MDTVASLPPWQRAGEGGGGRDEVARAEERESDMVKAATMAGTEILDASISDLA